MCACASLKLIVRPAAVGTNAVRSAPQHRFGAHGSQAGCPGCPAVGRTRAAPTHGTEAALQTPVTAHSQAFPSQNGVFNTMTFLHKHLLACAAAAACALPAVSYADVAFNVGAVTDYRYRGISQTRLKPALQGGIDFTSGGFYLGTWASTIKWIKDFGGDADVEIDVYGGYKGTISEGLAYDVGVLTYIYPSNDLSPSADTTEIYGALTFGPATLKYSHALTNTFANPDSKNSYYLDLSAGFDVGGVMFTPHIGYQKIKGPFSSEGSYTDYSLTVSKDFSGLVVSAAIVGTDADKSFYSSPVNGKFLGKTGVVLGLKYNF
jgi:uncharacterized protein (TIGR02001 family)